MSAGPFASINAARAAIVAEAKTWIGTRYHEQGDLKGVGVDCGMILVRIFTGLGLIGPFDPRPYPRDFMMHSAEERYIGLVQRCGGVEFAGPAHPGDVVVWRFGRCFSHGGVVTEWPRLIHAYSRAPGGGRVLDDDAERNEFLKRHDRRFFSLWPTS